MMKRTAVGRRRFLSASGAATLGSLAGCTGLLSGNESKKPKKVTLSDFRGSGPLVEDRPELAGAHIDDLPDLSGTLTLYLGGGEGGLYLDLIKLLQSHYPDFEVNHRIEPSSDLAQRITQEVEGGDSPTDVFLSVDAGSLGFVAAKGAATKLSKNALKPVPKAFRGKRNRWVGIAGRARSIPYNTKKFSASELPSDIFAFARENRFKNAIGWAPTYEAFQAFVTAMRIIDGREKTRQWLKGVQRQGVSRFRDEWFVSNAVADGEVNVGFANHYYALRVQASRPKAPIELAFTKNDAGALVNVAGAEIIQGTEKEQLATNFVRHLLTVEAQEFFATKAFAYPMISGVPPVGGLPRVDELAPPSIDLQKLSNLEPTLSLMREVGVL